MEFLNLGEHCQKPECNQTDFLPLQCKCGKVFCREHFNDHCLSGECELAPKPKEVNFKNDDKIFRCSHQGCRKGSLHEILCPKCNKHYCIEHRFHASCPEIDEETLANKIEQFEAPRRQFREANKLLQEKITENIRQALQSPKYKTASKIHLMRIKQKATGSKTVPANHRVYFAIKTPSNKLPKDVNVIENLDSLKPIINIDPDLKDTIPIFVSKTWTIGRALDSICESCNVKNENNKMGSPKLRLFRQFDGYCICPNKMESEIEELMKKEILVEGDRLVLEYIGEKVLTELSEESQIFLKSSSY